LVFGFGIGFGSGVCLMSREFPDWIDPWKAADGARVFEGSVPLARLERLVPLLSNSDGVAWFTVGFDYDFEQRARIRITVHAELQLLCQKSLEPYIEVVDRTTELSVIKEMSEQDLLPETAEAVLVDNRALAMASLVEDELIIGLPQVPRNPALDSVDFSVGNEASDAPGGEAEIKSRQSDQPGREQDVDIASAKGSGQMRKPFAELGKMMAELVDDTSQQANLEKNSKRD
jgi:uncharacterized protein